MVTTHNLGFPRIGAQRELKTALERYWKGQSSREELSALAGALRKRHWQDQAGLDLVPLGDFSFYDHVLDTSFMLGNIPRRVRGTSGDLLDQYFRNARGRTAGARDGVQPAAMTKWFDTNYHYIVPELDRSTTFKLDASRLLEQLDEARALGSSFKPVILGPVTYLWLGKSSDGSDKLELLPRLLPVYVELLARLAEHGASWVQIDEPALVTELEPAWQVAYATAYRALDTSTVKLLLTTYFGELAENLPLVARLPVQGVHIDALQAPDEIAQLCTDRVISLGVISGRNIWKTDLNAVLNWLEPLHRALGSRLWIAPSCSLLHVPVDLERERELDPELRSWLAFALQKLDELRILARALDEGRAAVRGELAGNHAALEARRSSRRVHDPEVRVALAGLDRAAGRRKSAYAERAPKQVAALDLPLLPTTTIGSFPQTAEVRAARSRHRNGELGEEGYQAVIRAEIERSVREQEVLQLDVLVHGEAERNDMVEYFGEQLEGYAFTQHGWVQSYGSRCVKPPILFGDIRRPKAMTVGWTQYAQSLTSKPLKGMLTGPVTMLNWSFVRDDQPRETSCRQLALAIRAEVLDLERAGVRIIQIDEAALREGLPLRRSRWAEYLGWAIESFRISANGVRDETQIHTHMCYSEFDEILGAIADMDADVITIESARSSQQLMAVLEHFVYPNAIGPGVYDIHSPNIPSQEQIESALRRATSLIPIDRLWVNPDCGLKTRSWNEVLPALRNMVLAAHTLRRELSPCSPGPTLRADDRFNLRAGSGH